MDAAHSFWTFPSISVHLTLTCLNIFSTTFFVLYLYKHDSKWQKKYDERKIEMYIIIINVSHQKFSLGILINSSCARQWSKNDFNAPKEPLLRSSLFCSFSTFNWVIIITLAKPRLYKYFLSISALTPRHIPFHSIHKTFDFWCLCLTNISHFQWRNSRRKKTKWKTESSWFLGIAFRVYVFVCVRVVNIYIAMTYSCR